MTPKYYYQPMVKDQNGNEYFPSCLYSFEVFRTKADAITFLKREGYTEEQIVIYKYHGKQIENPTFVEI